MSNPKKKTVYVIYYSMHGHIRRLAEEICKGLERSGVNAKLFQICETLPKEQLDLYAAPSKPADVPIISPSQLKDADGYFFGFPTWFGMAPSPVKYFFDTCVKEWFNGELVNKLVGTFFSSSAIGGGQETVALTTLPFFVNMGMIFIPLGRKHKNLLDISSAHGGTPFGSGTITGPDLSRQPNQLELELAEYQGFDFGNIINRTNFS